ncbi:efflux RND transporter permease subunit [Candidatus Fermentibacteria bacterium]|nr:efflux RND transporter permease subunit [Candidatus Fermentibacteria bacterium]
MSFSTARFSVGQPVLVNLLMIGIIVGGLFAIFSMPQELNPNISFNWVFVTIPYPGASPQESEDLVVIPVEKEIDKIDKVDEINTTAGEGFAFFLVKFEEMSSSDFTAKMQEVRLAVDKAVIPDETEDPIVEDFGSDDFVPVFSVAITYDTNAEVAAAVADDIVDEIERVSDVAKIQVSGLEDREIWVEVDPVRLNAQHLTLGSVVRALASRNVNLPGGTVEIGRSEFQVRMLGRFTSPQEIESLVLTAEPDGRAVRLADVGSVRMTRAENSVLSRIDGQPSLTISVSKKAGGSTFEIVGRIKEILAQYQERIPEGIEFTTTIDTTRHIRDILSVLRNNAVVGLVLIFGILFAFLGKGNALLAGLGIPISFLVAFILMWLTGQTINGSSVFGMIIVLGIIVDDAIIVLENVHRYRQQGVPLKDAVIQGTEEVLGPITTGILTTVAAFVPLMLIPGIMGKFMRVIPIVVSLSLLASLFEASTLLPSHINDWTKGSTRHKRPEFKFYLWLRDRYERLLTKLLCRRYWVVGGVVVLLFISIGLIPLVGVQMFGSEDLDFFRVLVKLPEGTSLEETDRVIGKIEAEALALPEQELAYVEANSGLYQGNSEWTIRKNVGQVIVNLVDRHERDRSLDEVIVDLRERISGISGISSLEFELPTSGPPTSKPVSVRITGKYFAELRGAADDLEALLAQTDGVFDIADDFPAGKQEIRIAIDEERAALRGLTVQEVALEVRTALSGFTATTYRDGDEDVDVIVKLPESARNSMEEILALRMSNYAGATVPLADVAEFSLHTTVTEIHRRDLARTLIVGADIDKSTTTVDKVMRQIAPHFDRIANRYEEIRFEIGGEFEEFSEAFQDMAKLFAIGVILIYLILGTQFRSYIQPLIILATVPFAFIGAMVGLIVAGDKFSITTLFGVVALAGIVVNDSIVLISFMNNARREGVDRWKSVTDAAVTRLRPIILTSVTTIGGLLPTTLGIGGSSAVWRPLANTIAWGLLFSTILTLIVIPCILSIVDDIRVKAGRDLVRSENGVKPPCEAT